MIQQLELFDNKVSIIEAPEGFINLEKKYVETPNVCNSCDARKLCVENKDNWCLNNSCMSFKRKDGIGVIFKYNNQ